MVAIFAVLIGLIIFMRRNDEKEEFTGAAKAAMDKAQAQLNKAIKKGNHNAVAAAQKQMASIKKMFR